MGFIRLCLSTVSYESIQFHYSTLLKKVEFSFYYCLEPSIPATAHHFLNATHKTGLVSQFVWHIHSRSSLRTTSSFHFRKKVHLNCHQHCRVKRLSLPKCGKHQRAVWIYTLSPQVHGHSQLKGLNKHPPAQLSNGALSNRLYQYTETDGQTAYQALSLSRSPVLVRFRSTDGL